MRSVLVANRGEIACRVMRTVQAQGLRAIAVYSQADAQSPHVKMADESVCIGPPPVGESYLDMDAILEAARKTGADAIHPGYGFLSENADFARACKEAGIIFIGPPAAAIDAMGNKAQAKRLMIAANVPCVPGYEGEDQAQERFTAAANEIGYPVMVKAAAGGGGRGMRLVHSADKLEEALKTARSEAQNAFGSGELILEKAILRPRHVEVQVFADAHGNCIHLNERDCSVQRRHQKVVEEAPCPVLTTKLRDAMGQAAVDAARAIDYRGAGTVEFLLGDDGGFYFLEMNTRLQVEHPVTEMITGLDLVALQLQVARGEPLGFEQGNVALSGHAIEVRLYAEDATQDFLPSTGDIVLWDKPAIARTDDGIETGGSVSPFYDPMLAKIVTHGETRDIARLKLIRALGESALFGPQTNRDFLIACLEREDFANGAATTAFIAENFPEGFAAETAGADVIAVAAATRLIDLRDASIARAGQVSGVLMNWSSTGSLKSALTLSANGHNHDLVIEDTGEGWRVAGLADEPIEVALIAREAHRFRFRVAGKMLDITACTDGQDIHISGQRHTFRFSDITGGAALTDTGLSANTVVAPMHGRLANIHVAVGDTVSKGQTVAVLEAMKMQHQLDCQMDGKISAIHAQIDAQVSADDVLIEIEDDDATGG
ncbi:MAG: ATP-grasp domain-containing protein [Ahrensia sp.]|nr:ATP-grasp domain-containing protein [Ahrensia sp.]